MSTEPQDDVDAIAAAWARERPDLPVRSIGVLTRVRRIAKVLEDDRRRTLARLGLEPAILDLLATLRRSGAPYRLRVGELAARCRVTTGAITQRVDRALADGLVDRERAADGAVRVGLTPRGEARLAEVVGALLHHEETLVARLADDDVELLAGHLRGFLRVLDADPPRGAPGG